MAKPNALINGIIPQSKLWILISAASYGELNHNFSSAGAEREGGLKFSIFRCAGKWNHIPDIRHACNK